MFGRRKPIEVETHPNDVTVFEPIKELGIFAVQAVPADSETGKAYGKAGVIDNPQRPFVDLHLNPNVEPVHVGPGVVRYSLGKVASYLAAHPDHFAGQEVVGVTYPRLGRVAERFGFEASPVNANTALPESLARKIISLAASHGYAPEAPKAPETQYFSDGAINYSAQGDTPPATFGDFTALHQSAEDLITRFGDQDQ